MTLVNIDGVKMDVFEGTTVDATLDILRKTQKMYDLRRILDEPFSNGDQKSRDAREEFERLSRDCPHGLMFSVGKAKGGVQWKHLPALTENAARRAALHPGQSAMERFTYVLTEPYYPHDLKWFRFAVTISSDSKSAPDQFEFVLPGVPFPRGYEGNSQTVQHLTKSDGGDRWEASAPLLPLRLDDP